MNSSSPTVFEMGLDELYPVSCYNCNDDCMGITEHIFRNAEDNSHANFLISNILEDKGYYLANYSSTIYQGVLTPCLTLYKMESGKFMVSMNRLGYQIVFLDNNSRNYLRNIIIKKDNLIVDPKSLIYIFRQLEVIK